MFTLEDVEDPLHNPAASPTADGWPVGFDRGAQLRLAGGSHIRLPIDPAGIHLGDPDAHTVDLFGEHALAARSIVLAGGRFATPLQFDSGSAHPTLPAPGLRTRLILNAARLTSSGGPVYGLGTFVHQDGGVRPGSSAVTFVAGSWFTDRDDFAVTLASELAKSTAAVQPISEQNAYPWTLATLLLSGPSPTEVTEYIRQLRLAAGLFKVALRIEFDADARFQNLIRAIKTKPPNQLLVREHLGSGQKYIDQFHGFNPNGYADWIAGGGGLTALLRELVCHLSLLSESPATVSEPLTWREAGQQISAIADETKGALVLSDRAHRQLDKNPYPDPQRMVEQVRMLAEVAALYRAGSIGMRLEDVCASRGLTIALFDNGLNTPQLTIDGTVTTLRAEPHVKVDDYVSPDRCGRIYFAIDSANARFVIDHIGLHDYA